MQSNRKVIGLIIVLIGLAIIAAIIYFGFMRREEGVIIDTPPGTAGQLPAGTETGTTTPGDRPRDSRVYDISKEDPYVPGAGDIAKRSMSYAERFGSFSSHSDYGNFTDLKLYMTDSLKTWTDTYVAEQRQRAEGGVYYGIQTRALTTEVLSFDEEAGTARTRVGTERRESTEEIGGGLPYYQNLEISFRRVGGEWLIDGFYWEK